MKLVDKNQQASPKDQLEMSIEPITRKYWLR